MVKAERGNELLKRHVVIAADVTGADAALELASEIGDRIAMLKVGLQAFVSSGPELCKRLQNKGVPFLLDLKLNDIPNTVGKAAVEVFSLGAEAVTVHALSGPDSLKAAVNASGEMSVKRGGKAGLVLAVTVLTSLSDASLKIMGFSSGCSDTVLRLADMAVSSGVHGIVCSPWEVSELRRRFGDDIRLLVPGIRPVWAGVDDQKRSSTPSDAVRTGATWIVIGRPVTRADDKNAALDKIASELEGEVSQ